MLMERRLIVSMETAQIMKKFKIFPGAEMFLVTFVWARSSDGLSFQENLYWSSELKSSTSAVVFDTFTHVQSCYCSFAVHPRVLQASVVIVKRVGHPD